MRVTTMGARLPLEPFRAESGSPAQCLRRDVFGQRPAQFANHVGRGFLNEVKDERGRL